MCVFGTTYYGTPRAFVEQKLAEGNDVILVLMCRCNEYQASDARGSACIYPATFLPGFAATADESENESDEQIDGC